jgi:hypothetical protein
MILLTILSHQEIQRTSGNHYTFACMKRNLRLVAVIAFIALPATQSNAASLPKCASERGKSQTHNLIDKFKTDMLMRGGYDRAIPVSEAQEWSEHLLKAAWEDGRICMDMWNEEIDMQIKINNLENEVARLKRENEQLKGRANIPAKK